MSITLKGPSSKAPYFPVEQKLQLDLKTDAISAVSANTICTDGACSTPVEVGLFFDGTNNHLARDLYGERTAVISDKEAEHIKARAKASGKSVQELIPTAPPSISRPLPVMARSHSNIARLYRAYPDNKQADGYFSFYIQGVGTPFPEIGELTESAEGKAFAKGGQARIMWGLLQVLNGRIQK